MEWLDLIIPCWRDEARTLGLLGRLRAWGAVGRAVVAVAQPAPGFVGQVTAAGARCELCPEPSRGAQQARGAAVGRAPWLLFHHADSDLTEAHLGALAAARERPGLAGGAFHRAFDGRHPLFRWIEPFERRRAACGGPVFGDQSIFANRAALARAGGFPEQPLLEDVELSRRLRRAGAFVLLDPPMRSSDRWHRRDGAARRSLRNGCILAAYYCGVSPARLHRWYYAGRNAHGATEARK